MRSGCRKCFLKGTSDDKQHRITKFHNTSLMHIETVHVVSAFSYPVIEKLWNDRKFMTSFFLQNKNFMITLIYAPMLTLMFDLDIIIHRDSSHDY